MSLARLPVRHPRCARSESNRDSSRCKRDVVPLDHGRICDYPDSNRDHRLASSRNLHPPVGVVSSNDQWKAGMLAIDTTVAAYYSLYTLRRSLNQSAITFILVWAEEKRGLNELRGLALASFMPLSAASSASRRCFRTSFAFSTSSITALPGIEPGPFGFRQGNVGRTGLASYCLS